MVTFLSASPAGPRKMRGRARLATLTIAVAVAVTAGVLYWAMHTPAAAVSPAGSADVAPPGAPPHAADSLDVLAERLAQRLQREPDDAEGWALLARTYAVLERQQEAVAAYRQALALLPADVQLRVELSELTDPSPRAVASGGRVPGHARR
jgi:cytochrome c-type biogenesis protein CcmH